jgi:hypothetical protein
MTTKHTRRPQFGGPAWPWIVITIIGGLVCEYMAYLASLPVH